MLICIATILFTYSYSSNLSTMTQICVLYFNFVSSQQVKQLESCTSIGLSTNPGQCLYIVHFQTKASKSMPSFVAFVISKTIWKAGPCENSVTLTQCLLIILEICHVLCCQLMNKPVISILEPLCRRCRALHLYLLFSCRNGV